MHRFVFASLASLLVACGQSPADSLENVPPTMDAPPPATVAETATDPGTATAPAAASDAGATGGDASRDASPDAPMGAKCTELATSCCAIVLSCTGEINACKRVAAAKDDAACATLLTRYEGVGCDHELDVPAPLYPPSASFHGCPYKGNHGGAIP